jgi:2-keto-4-pentenoate hydratase/2-oxohepta-3-ene-1,7-dioic acid hydratase in catechol pathway
MTAMNRLKIDSNTFVPGKIVCIGRNYLEHIQELGNETPQQMVIFNKPNSSISTRLFAVREETLHFEGEICFVVQDGGLYGVGFGLDLTKRELQSALKAKGLPWERAKAFDGAACFSDFVTLGDIDIPSLSLELVINGKLQQSGGYELMMHKPDQIFAEIQQFMSLDDGDIIMTGTPKGVGQVATGDRFEGSIKSDKNSLVSQEWLAE